MRGQDGLFWDFDNDWRIGIFSLWDGSDGERAVQGFRRPAGTVIGAVNKQPVEGGSFRGRGDGGNTVFFGYNGDGSRVCQFRDYEIVAGYRYHYGGEHRNHGYFMDFKFVRD